jgi:hypothetical protein
VLENADHMHFCDRVERSHEFFRSMPNIGPFGAVAKRTPPMSELTPGKNGHLFANGLGTAHLDAVLRGDPAAADFLANALSNLSLHGIAAHEITRTHRL